MGSLHQIFYTSVATAPLGAVGISELLVKARDKNQRLEITGILTYHNRRFMQLLEGEEKRVNDLYETIQKDPRHRSVELLFSGATQQRDFGSWAMGYFNLGDHSAEEIAAFEQFVDSRMDQLRLSQSRACASELYDIFAKMLLGSGR